jgi:hypothetical protein
MTTAEAIIFAVLVWVLLSFLLGSAIYYVNREPKP